MSVDNDVGFWKGLATAIVGAAGGLFGYHKYMEGKLDKKADKHAVNNAIQTMNSELTLQRGHIAKLFDQARENEQRAQDRHERIMERFDRHNGVG